MDRTGHCIFCFTEGELTDEHVISAHVRRLAGANETTPITWQKGTAELWAGPLTADVLGDVAIRAVCADCNNRWMSNLDARFAKDLKWWLDHPTSRLGDARVDVIRRFMVKLLWVVAVGEAWARAGEWLAGRAPAPGFIPLTILDDGPRIAASGTSAIDDLGLLVSVGIGRIAPTASDLVWSEPPLTDGIQDTAAVRRINAGLGLTLRSARVHLHVVATQLDDRWRVRWPPGASEVGPSLRAKSMGSVSAAEPGRPRLEFVGAGPIPDVAAFYAAVTDAAIAATRDSASDA